MTNITPSTNKPSAPYNFFDDDTTEHYISYYIAPFLSPTEALRARLTSRKFARAFAANLLWQEYYKTRELVPLKAFPIGRLGFSSLIKTFSIWTSIQEIINKKVEGAIKNTSRLDSLRTHCIAIIALSELAPLHSFVVQILQRQCFGEDLSKDEMLLRVVKNDQKARVSTSVRILAINSLSHRATEQQVYQALISIITESTYMGSDNDALCRGAMNALAPYLVNPEIEQAVLTCLTTSLCHPCILMPALKVYLPNPKILDAVIDRYRGGLCGFAGIVRGHLNNQAVVNQLLQRFNESTGRHIVGELAKALGPVANQIPVQRALCQKLKDLSSELGFDHDRKAIIDSLRSTPWDEEIKKEFCNSTPELTRLAHEDTVSRLRNYDPVMHRQELLTAMSNDDESTRRAAATALAPLALDDPEILSVFLDRIKAKDLQAVGVVVMPAFAKLAHRKEIRSILITGGSLDGKIDVHLFISNSELKVATINVLQPFVDEPEVREAFLARLKSDGCPYVRCALINILAPQLEKEDVRSLFIMAAQDKLWRQNYCGGEEWQIAAIGKLAPFVHKPEVIEVLLEVFNKSSYSIRATLIKALCPDSKKPLIPIKTIFVDCMNDSVEVRSAASQALNQWINLATL